MDFFTGAVQTVAEVSEAIIQVAVVFAKVLAVPFGVPFDETYHHDFDINYKVEGSITNKPPPIFGLDAGLSLASSGTLYSVQCADCGITGKITVEGSLAFNISAITKGSVSLVNHDSFAINAVLGITVEAQGTKSIEDFTQQIVGIPLSPLTIPGIVSLGPEATISAAFDLTLNGKAELIVGAKFELSSGTAVLDIVDKSRNKLDGLTPSVAPVFNVRIHLSLFFTSPALISFSFIFETNIITDWLTWIV